MITAPAPTRKAPSAVEAAIDQGIALLGFRCGLAGSLAWTAMGVESVLRPFQDNRRETFWILPFIFTMVTLICVHLVQRGRSRLERWGFAGTLIASALMLVGNIGLQLNIKPLEALGAPAGPVIWLVGLLGFGIGTLNTGAFPRSAGWALILFEPASIAAAFALSPIAPMLPRGAYSGNVGKGAALAVLALALRRLPGRHAAGAAVAS